MISLEQVRLLEQKVTGIIALNENLSKEKELLVDRLKTGQKRIEELEAQYDRLKAQIDELREQNQQFMEERGRVEEGILSVLDQLNRFEDAVEGGEAPVAAPPPAVKQELPVTAGPEVEPEPEPEPENEESAEVEPEEAVELPLGESSPEPLLTEEDAESAPEELSIPVLSVEDPLFAEEILQDEQEETEAGETPHSGAPGGSNSGELEIF